MIVSFWEALLAGLSFKKGSTHKLTSGKNKPE